MQLADLSDGVVDLMPLRRTAQQRLLDAVARVCCYLIRFKIYIHKKIYLYR